MVASPDETLRFICISFVNRMSLRSCFPVRWKPKRWDNMKLYSTHYRTLMAEQTYIVYTNKAIRDHGENGHLDTARNLFDGMPIRTVVSWNTMLSGYSKWAQFDESLSLVSKMHHSNIRLNEATFFYYIKRMRTIGVFIDGKQIHCLVLKSGYECFEFVGSSLLFFYANCFHIEEAERVFDQLHVDNELLWTLMLVGYVQCNLMSDAFDVFIKMPKKDVVAWTKLISGYAKCEDGCEKALKLFQWMRESGEVMPNEYTFHTVTRACGRLGFLCQGKVVHGLLVKCGFEFDHSIGGALIEFYCSCEALDDAMRVYDRLVNPCMNASNSLIDGLLSMGKIEDAELIFNRLTEANSVSYNLMINGYAVKGKVDESKRLFERMPHRTIISLNTMITMYFRNGEIEKALKLFKERKEERNLVTWNSMISGYFQNNLHEESLELYVTMRRLAIGCTRSTFSVLFRACTCLGSLQQGQLLHAHLLKTPFESNVYVGTSLVDMYSRCGSIAEAQESFSSISSPNVAAWTALINGYSHHGLGSEAILLFECMLEQEIVPNAATFVGILSACRHAGLINQGMRIFHSMESYGVVPTLEHYACVVDLLGRSGHLHEAEEFIKGMPIEADAFVWTALLSACWSWMNMEVGERVAQKMFNLDPMPVSAYVVLSNIYAILGKWEKKMHIRNRLTNLEVKKDPGSSWIELSNRVHTFSVEDRNNPNFNVIYATLEQLTANLNSNVQFDH